MRAPPPILLIALLFGVAGVGCGEPFPPPNRIQELRVLAIKSEPVAPAPGESTTLSALVFTPEPDPTVTYSWSWCPLAGPANEGYPCAISEAELTVLAGMAGQTVPPYELGTEATAQLPHMLNPDVLRQICTMGAGSMRPTMVGGQALTLDCNGGFPVQVKVKVKTATDEVVAIRKLRLRFDVPGDPNTNPTIGQLYRTIMDANDDEKEVSADPITATPQLVLTRGKVSYLRVEVAPENAEPYTGRDENQQPLATQESLTLSWFVESGNTKADDTAWAPKLMTMLSRALKNEWEPGRTKDYAKGTARVIVVLRDNREGVTWTEGAVQLGEPQ